MTAHDHTTYVPGCYRCELGRDEARDAERDELREALEQAESVLRRAQPYIGLLRQYDAELPMLVASARETANGALNQRQKGAEDDA